MKELAINGGTPAFQPDELAKLVPAWPPVYPETEQKLLEIYRSGKWGLCGQYEQMLMKEFAEFQDAKYSSGCATALPRWNALCSRSE